MRQQNQGELDLVNVLKWVAVEDIAADGIHWTMSGTQKVMEFVAARVKEVTGKEIMDGMTIRERPYSGISRAHYRVGCHRCMRNHDGHKCPPLPASRNDHSISDISNTTIQESFLSADSSSYDASDEMSERSDGSPSVFRANDNNDNKADNIEPPSYTLATIESPDMPEGYSVLLRSQSRSFSRSSSAKKRELEKNNSSHTDANGKKQCVKGNSLPTKGHVSRGNNQKLSKK